MSTFNENQGDFDVAIEKSEQKNVGITKRDFLIAIEKDLQKKWIDQGTFQVDSPSTKDHSLDTLSPSELRERYPKYFATFPYLYMNGRPHLGHAFTMSKVDFAVGYERLKGRNALFPCGFHCTGTTIVNAANSIADELSTFGDLENISERDLMEKIKLKEEDNANSTSSLNHKAKKAILKGNAKYQFQILESVGVPRSEMKHFANPEYWIKYFPAVTKSDLEAIGARIDWRRSFITTDANPYYDSFIRWQMNKFERFGLSYSKQFTVFSPKHQQACMDHDRSIGEGVRPLKYNAIKLKWTPRFHDLDGRSIYLIAIVDDPECLASDKLTVLVNKETRYDGAVAEDGSVYILCYRGCENMAYQGHFDDEFTKVYKNVSKCDGDYYNFLESNGVVLSNRHDHFHGITISGDKLHRAKVFTPTNKIVEIIATDDCIVNDTLTGIIITDKPYKSLTKINGNAKGVTSSKKNPARNEILFLQPVISTPEGKIQLVTGRDIKTSKSPLFKELEKKGLAFTYAELPAKVVGRSNELCVVAYCDQWFINYNEPEWKKLAIKLSESLNILIPEVEKQFKSAVQNLYEWPCGRLYGLGSKIPCDPRFLVESLSDSSIYMAYYTICHLLHGSSVDGQTVGPLGISPDQMTNQVWDFVFSPSDEDLPSNLPITPEQAKALRREFTYFYPLDLRSTGKDLIENHMSIFIHAHASIFAEEYWPRAVRVNGHLMMNSAKMSKSTGNFLTLRSAVDKYGADATRFALADAGDGVEDGNFDEAVANSAILRMKTLIDWCTYIMKNKDMLRTGQELSFFDKLFMGEINSIIAQTDVAYSKTKYKEAAKFGFYDMHAARDFYKEATSTSKQGEMHLSLVERWIEVQTLLILPIAPHLAEHIWTHVLEKKTSVHNALFPAVEGSTSNEEFLKIQSYLKSVLKDCKDAESALIKRAHKLKKKNKANEVIYDPYKSKNMRIYFTKKYSEWQDKCIKIMEDLRSETDGTIDRLSLVRKLGECKLIKDPKIMPFCATYMIDSGNSRSDRDFKPDEAFILSSIKSFIEKDRKLSSCEIVCVEEIETKNCYGHKFIESALPFHPAIEYYN